jgi:hypothetical protein
MSSPNASTKVAITAVGQFVKAEEDASDGLRGLEMAKAKAARRDARDFAKGRVPVFAAAFGRAFSGFERIVSRGSHRPKHAPAFRITADVEPAARPVVFAGDFDLFDRLSIIYGGLFRGSIVVNYTLGLVAFALSLASMLPMPHFVAELVSERVRIALQFIGAGLEIACIVAIGVIFCLGQTPSHDETDNRVVRRRGFARRVAQRWHQRWLEYRLLAETFRYQELLLPLATGVAHKPPFALARGSKPRWYGKYFERRSAGASSTLGSVRHYREQALALMAEQIRHHTGNSQRRGAIVQRLHRIAVDLFFASLVLCLLAVLFECFTPGCEGSQWTGCAIVRSFDANWRSFVLFFAGIAPVLAAAIHGVLSTAEYAKLAETSAETAERVGTLYKELETIDSDDAQATPETLAPMRGIVEQFADEVISEAMGWKAMLRDKNVPLT